jgi:hypothetical protein
MDFQIIYYKNGEDDIIIENVEFKNISSLKRWYKKQFENNQVKYPFFEGWNITENKSFNYTIKSYYNDKHKKK